MAGDDEVVVLLALSEMLPLVVRHQVGERGHAVDGRVDGDRTAQRADALAQPTVTGPLNDVARLP